MRLYLRAKAGHIRLIHASFRLETKLSSSSAILFFTFLQVAGQFLHFTPTMLRMILLISRLLSRVTLFRLSEKNLELYKILT